MNEVPDFSPLVDDINEWLTDFAFPEFADFDLSADRRAFEMGGATPEQLAIDDAREADSPSRILFRQGRFPVSIHNEKELEEPAPRQKAAMEFLATNRRQLAEVILGAILSWYRDWSNDIVDDGSDPEIPILYPKIDSPAGLKPLIRLTGIDIHEAGQKGMANIGFTFDSVWDDEHGHGIVTNRFEVLEMGGADVAFDEAEVEEDDED